MSNMLHKCPVTADCYIPLICPLCQLYQDIYILLKIGTFVQIHIEVVLLSCITPS